MVVTAAIDASDDTLTIEDIKYGTYWLPNDTTGRHLCLVYPDGTHVCRKVLGAPDADTLALDAALGKACPAGDLGSLLVSFLHFVRFNEDEIEIHYHTTTVATTTLGIRTIEAEITTTTTTTTTSSSTSTSTTITSTSTSSSTTTTSSSSTTTTT